MQFKKIQVYPDVKSKNAKGQSSRIASMNMASFCVADLPLKPVLSNRQDYVSVKGAPSFTSVTRAISQDPKKDSCQVYTVSAQSMLRI